MIFSHDPLRFATNASCAEPAKLHTQIHQGVLADQVVVETVSRGVSIDPVNLDRLPQRWPVKVQHTPLPIHKDHMM